MDPPELEFLPCRFWELNPGPLEEQPALLTAEPSLQTPREAFLRLHGSYILRRVSDEKTFLEMGLIT